MNRRVFLTELPAPPLNIDAAKSFGAIVPLLPNGHKSTWKTDKLTEHFIDTLIQHRYAPMHDFILVVGNNVLMTTLVAAIAAEYGELKVLYYHSVDRQYVERNIGLPK